MSLVNQQTARHRDRADAWSLTPARRPLGEIVVAAENATLRLADGAVLIDFASGGVGHGHPALVAALRHQQARMPLSARVFFSPMLGEFCRALAQEFAPLTVVYPCNSRDEALEGALKLARGHGRRRHHVISLHGAGQGRTVHLAQMELCGSTEAALAAIGPTTAAVVVAPVATVGPVRPTPRTELIALRRRCNRHGALLIFDDSIGGLGARGSALGSAVHGVTPDVIVLGEALGGGVYPGAAYLARPAVNGRVYRRRDPVLHATTTGAGPSACAVGIALIRLVREGLADRAAAVGLRLNRDLWWLARNHPQALRQTEGAGLLWSLEFASPAFASQLVARTRSAGLLLRQETDWPQAIVQLRVPMLVTNAELDQALAVLAAQVQAVSLASTATTLVR